MEPERKVIEVVGGIIRRGDKFLLRTAVTHAYPALEHEVLGWYTPAEMSALDFCPADAELLPVVFGDAVWRNCC